MVQSVLDLKPLFRKIPDGLKTRFEVHDFFSFAVPENEKFDLIYDYTSVLVSKFDYHNRY